MMPGWEFGHDLMSALAVCVRGAVRRRRLRGVFVKQKLNLTEVITGCDMENKYKARTCWVVRG